MRRVMALMSLALLAVTTACGGTGGSSPAGSAQGKGDSKEPYRIGQAVALTGKYAYYGQYQMNGANLAVKEVNAKGGINGHLLELVARDTKAEPQAAVIAAQQLMTVDKVPVFASMFSGVVNAQLPIVQQAATKTVLVNSGAGLDKIRGAGPNIFSLQATNYTRGGAQADYLYNKLAARKISVFYDNSDVGLGLLQAVTEKFKLLGGQVLESVVVEETTKDFRTQLTKVQAQKPDAIVLENYAQTAAVIMKQAVELDMDKQFTWMGFDGIQNEVFNKALGNAANGVYSMQFGFNPADKRPVVQEFITKYKTAYGEAPEFYAATNYDAVYAIAKAIEIGGYSPEGIRKGLEQIDLEGLSGQIRFDAEHIIQSAPLWSRYENGGWPLVQ